MNKKATALTKSLTALGVTSLLFLTGCASNTPTAAETASQSAATSSPSASAVPTQTSSGYVPVELTPEQKKNMTPEEIAEYEKMSKMTPEELAAFQEANHGAFSSRLVADSQSVKAGSSIRVTGGTYAPGVSVKIYGAQLMAMPSYDAANDMYHQVGEQVLLTETITVVTNEKGQFDAQLLIPAGTAPQQIDIISETSDGNGDLVRAEIV